LFFNSLLQESWISSSFLQNYLFPLCFNHYLLMNYSWMNKIHLIIPKMNLYSIFLLYNLHEFTKINSYIKQLIIHFFKELKLYFISSIHLVKILNINYNISSLFIVFIHSYLSLITFIFSKYFYLTLFNFHFTQSNKHFLFVHKLKN